LTREGVRCLGEGEGGLEKERKRDRERERVNPMPAMTHADIVQFDNRKLGGGGSGCV
jgi:hypothetical protein